MRLKSLIFISVSVLVAGGTAMMVRGWINAERARLAAVPKQEAPAPKAQTHILVAKSELSVGQFVRADHLRWAPWPDDALAPVHVVQGQRSLEEFVGAVARSRMNPGEPVTDSRLVSPNNAGFLAAVLEPGYRAVSVSVNVTSGISGFVFPGDRVDLILTHIIPQEAGPGGRTQERRASETVLDDIRVLAIDQKLDSKPGEPVIARTVTFEVTPKQSERIALAADMGKLSLSLRSLSSNTTTGKDPVSGYTLDSDASRLLSPLVIANSQRKLVIIRGDKTEEIKVNGVQR